MLRSASSMHCQLSQFHRSFLPYRKIRFASSAPTAGTSVGAVKKPLPPKPQKQLVGKIGRIGQIKKNRKTTDDNAPSSGQLFFHAGLPMIGFSLLAVWVLKNSLEGKTKEYETSRGQASRSERQARMEEEHENMMEKLNKIRNTDFDNTKRIERPEEILERRRKEREKRNVWYRRFGRWIIGRE